VGDGLAWLLETKEYSFLGIQGGQMKSGQILSHIISKTVSFSNFIHWLLSTSAVYGDQWQHNGFKFRTSGRGYVDGG
jgi:hypothetical protein